MAIGDRGVDGCALGVGIVDEGDRVGLQERQRAEVYRVVEGGAVRIVECRSLARCRKGRSDKRYRWRDVIVASDVNEGGVVCEVVVPGRLCEVSELSEVSEWLRRSWCKVVFLLNVDDGTVAIVKDSPDSRRRDCRRDLWTFVEVSRCRDVEVWRRGAWIVEVSRCCRPVVLLPKSPVRVLVVFCPS